MIVRFWLARSPSERQTRAYLEHFRSSVLPKICGVEGYVGATVLTRRTDSEVEILVATVWQSLEAVRQFAGPDFEAAVVAEEAAPLLTEFDRRVRHFEVAMTDLREGTPGSPPG